MRVDVEIISTTTCVLSNEALGISLLNCSLKLESLIPKLSSDVDVSGLCSHTKANDKSTFNKLVWVMSEDFSIFACSWF